MQEETKRMQAAEPRMRMKEKYAQEVDREKRKRRVLGFFLAVLFVSLAVALLMNKRDEKKYKEAGLVQAPKSSEELEDQNFEEVKLMFSKAGFKNIELKPQYDLTVETSNKNGQIVSVSIDGNTKFYTGWYEPDAEVWNR